MSREGVKDEEQTEVEVVVVEGEDYGKTPWWWTS